MLRFKIWVQGVTSPFDSIILITYSRTDNTKMQVKFAQKGFTKTASGKLNSAHMNDHKALDLDDFDVQMLSPQFL